MAPAPHLRVPPKEPQAQKARRMNDEASRSGTERPALLSFDEMPHWFQEDNNQWVLGGYRPISNSVRASFRSWWYLHNETINIYSHLIPAVVFLFSGWPILQYLVGKYSETSGTNLTAFSCFILTATLCYACSALYHTLTNHSYSVDHLCHRLDMLGIGLFIIGDIVLGVHIILWCETTIRNSYWAMVSQPLCTGASASPSVAIETNINPANR